MARMFVAVWPPPELLTGLRRDDVDGVRWTPADRWHVTLRFLGEVGDDQVAPLCQVLQETGARHLPCPAVLGPATTRLGRAVLAVPVAGLDPLGAAVIDATRAFGSPPEDRPFVGHLTVARGRGGRPVPSRLAGRPIEGAWDVTELTLVGSRLGREGPSYDVVFRS